MRKAIVPSVLFAAVFAVSLIFQKYTLCSWEYKGLFLFSSDYFSEVFRSPWPISNLLGDFLVQFYYFPVLGAAINGLLVAGVYLCIRVVTRFIPCSVVPAAASCLTWWLLCRAIDPVPAVRILLLSGVAAAISLPLPIRRRKPVLWAELAVSLAVCGFSAFVATDKTVSGNEKWAKLQDAMEKSDWDRALEVATPEATTADGRMLPYAILALGESGRLPYRLIEYPVTDGSDFDFAGYSDQIVFFFNSLLAASMCDYAESIHGVFQSSCSYKHNTGFGSLRALIRYNALAGNREMVEKYVKVLSRSVLNSGYGKRYLQMMKDGERACGPNDSWNREVRSHNEVENLLYAMTSGVVSRALLDRILCYYIVTGRNDLFVKTFDSVKQYYDPVPPLFEMQIN